ncbi:MAG: EAL domain-containing protein [Acidobacteria bacterium]|nr:EAL domain-containing protein [Acidobacteriota bacterium]
MAQDGTSPDTNHLRYRHIVESASDGIICIDESGTVLSANAAVSTIFGYEPDELIGQNLTTIIPEPLRERHREGLRRHLEEGTHLRRKVRFPGLRKDGTIVELEISYGEYVGAHGSEFIGVIRDVTAELESGRRLREDEERYRDFFQNAPIGFHRLGPDGTFHAVNNAELAMLGYEYTELVGHKSLRDVIAPEQRESFDRNMDVLEATGELRNIDYAMITKDGRRVIARLSATALRDSSGKIVSTRGTIVDVSFEHETLAALRDLNQQYKVLFERNLAGIFRGTIEGRVVECNDAYARILGYEGREQFLADSGVDPLLDVRERDGLYRRLIDEKTLSNIEVVVRQRDGSPIWVVENLSLIDDVPGRPPVIEGTIFDVTARKLAEERVAYQAHHDGLTGLPNPEQFRTRLDMAIEASKRTRRQVAVMFLDLDNFKAINDTRGHAVGNQLLQLVAFRIERILRPEDTVARLGGDEFTIVAGSMHSKADAALVAEKILTTLTRPYLLEGREIYISASIGIAMYPEDGVDHDTLLRKADISMYHAKELGRNRFVFCSLASSERAVAQMTLESDLRRALDRKEFVVHFQPQIESRTGEVVALEALVRWNHPERGLLLPAEFIPVAERAHLIVPIGEWVMREACRRAAQWHVVSPDLRVAVNLSSIQFQQADFEEMVDRVLRDTGVPPQLLELEITESVAMRNPEAALEILRSLKAKGIRISIDDFGTGYSSLSYLSRFPIDSLKIDQRFVRDIERGGADSMIISAVIALAHQLKLTVVAEGVETETQAEFLRARDCEHQQGFLFSHPLPADEIDFLLGNTRGREA